MRRRQGRPAGRIRLILGFLPLLGGVLVLAQGSPLAADPTAAAEAHFELGRLYHEKVFESLDQAIAEYEKAVRAKPDFAQAHFNLGLSYHTKARLTNDDKELYRRALAEYKLYLKYEPKGEQAVQAKQNIKALESRLR